MSIAQAFLIAIYVNHRSQRYICIKVKLKLASLNDSDKET